MDQLNDVQGAFSNPDFIETQPILIDDNIEEEEEDFDASTFVRPADDYDIVDPPHFPIILWNVRGRCETELPRTNNSLEAFNLAFKV